MTQNTQAALGMRRVVRPTTEQMLKAMAEAADEQRRVLVGADTLRHAKNACRGLKTRRRGIFG